MTDPDQLVERIDSLAKYLFRSEPEKLEKYRRVMRVKFLESLAEHPERLNSIAAATDGQLCRMLEMNIAKIPPPPPAAPPKPEPPHAAAHRIETPKPDLAPPTDSPEWIFKQTEPEPAGQSEATNDVLSLDRVEVSSPYYKPDFPPEARQSEPELDLPPMPVAKPPEPETPTIIFCPHCRELNQFNSAKCDNCGTPLHEPYTFRPPEVIVDKRDAKAKDYESKALLAFFLSFLTCCCGPLSVYVFFLSINELKNATETQNIILSWLAMIVSGIFFILWILSLVLQASGVWHPLQGFKF